MKYWEIIADNLSKAGWSWGCVSALDSEGRTIWIADAHCDDGKRFVVRADEKLTAFVELESAIHSGQRVGCIAWLGDVFILHHQNSPPALSGYFCARGSGHPTYYCRVDSRYRQLDCPPPRKGSCLRSRHW